MTKILAIDLGKFKSVTCLLETETNATEFWTLVTDLSLPKTPSTLPCNDLRRLERLGR